MANQPAPNPSGAGLDIVSVQMRIPEFWSDMPKLWFAQFEAVMAPQKQGDGVKFDMVIAKLGRDALRQVSDLIGAAPEVRLYENLKKRLLTIYEESADTQFQRLVGEMELGTQKPSQLLRKMAELAKNSDIPDNALRRLWISRLPANVRAVLAGSEDTKLERIAVIADRIVENLGSSSVAAVSTESSSAVLHTETKEDLQATVMKEMLQQLQAMRMEIDAIKSRGRSSNRSSGPWYRQRSVSRAKSTQRRFPGDPEWLCRFHYRFGERARSCEQPCNWAQKAKTSGN